MIAGLIGGAATVIVVAGILVAMAFAIRNAEQRAADARVDAANKAGQLAIAAADIATWKNTATDERRRADALDDVLDEVATSGDAAGARSRVLSRWARAGDSATDPKPAAGDGSHAVPAPPPAATAADRDSLIRPGD
jgi:hypothetical protein